MTGRSRIAALVDELADLARRLDRPALLMEVCGTHTVNAGRAGLASLLPENVRLLSGPGCPVCVTPQRTIDALIALGLPESAGGEDVTIATYGDLVRVPGAGGSLERVRGEGADVRVVTSSLEAVAIARAEPDRRVVFAAIGFETTAPATAAAVLAAEREGVDNFTIVPSHKLVRPAMRALLDDPGCRVRGFLCPGHVSVVTGAEEWRPIVDDYDRPCVVAGFSPLQIVEGVVHLVRQLVDDRAELENLYPEVVRPEGNPRARALVDEVFVPADSAWRSLGTIPASGLDLRPAFARFDALARFGVALGEDREPPGCLCGDVISGKAEPVDCGLFGDACTPLRPVGPCMVSSEGTCQAWFRFRRREGAA